MGPRRQETCLALNLLPLLRLTIVQYHAHLYTSFFMFFEFVLSLVFLNTISIYYRVYVFHYYVSLFAVLPFL